MNTIISIAIINHIDNNTIIIISIMILLIIIYCTTILVMINSDISIYTNRVMILVMILYYDSDLVDYHFLGASIRSTALTRPG